MARPVTRPRSNAETMRRAISGEAEREYRERRKEARPMIRVCHLADLHLGRRQFYRSNQFGINTREADAALAFRRAVDGIVAAKPDVILVAGDVFHSPAPSNVVRLEAANQFERLGACAPTLVVGGNHDTPKSVELGSPITLLAKVPGVTVAHQEQSRWVDDALGVGICLMPHAAVLRGEQPVVGVGDQPIEVLLIHGATPGLHGLSDVMDGVGARFDPSCQSHWCYIALGDWHVARQVAPNAWYSGSLEYVSSNPWGELKDEAGRGKGWILATLESGAPPVVEFQQVVTRPHVDLPPIDATGMSADDVIRIIPEPPAGAVVRQVITGLSRGTRRMLLSYEKIKAARLTALHYNLDIRIERRPAQSIDAPGILEPREPWEEEQDRLAAYWDGSEPVENGPLPDLSSFDPPSVDPYCLNERTV